MKFLAHRKGMHFHIARDCRYVDVAYHEVTPGQIKDRGLDACPLCIKTTLSAAQREQLDCMGITPEDQDRERELVLQWMAEKK